MEAEDVVGAERLLRVLRQPQVDHLCGGTGPVGERSHTVHAYCVNTLAGEVFTRVNTFPWQVFTHLPVKPEKSLC